MVYKSGQIFLPFCHNARVWRTDRRTDRQTDRLYRVCITCSAVKTEFLLTGLTQQLAKSNFCSLDTARNLGLMFDNRLTFSDQISALPKSCYSQIRQLHCIRPYLDLKTAITTATSIVHSNLEYCNSLYYDLPECQLNRLQLIQKFSSLCHRQSPKSSLLSNLYPGSKSKNEYSVHQKVTTPPRYFLQYFHSG